MARKDPNLASETLEEIDSFFDRAAQKVADNPWPFVAGLGTVLAVALIISVADTFAADNREAASETVGRVQTAYLEAMGAPLLSPRFSEPANPESARATREDYAAQLIAAAAEHPGSSAAAAGRIEAAGLLADLGDHERARSQLREAAEEAPADSALRGSALFLLAAFLEATDMSEASRRYEAVGRIADFPGAPIALAHAARTAVEAGEDDRALALFDEFEATPEEERLPAPPFVTSRLRELRASRTQVRPAAAP